MGGAAGLDPVLGNLVALHAAAQQRPRIAYLLPLEPPCLGGFDYGAPSDPQAVGGFPGTHDLVGNLEPVIGCRGDDSLLDPDAINDVFSDSVERIIVDVLAGYGASRWVGLGQMCELLGLDLKRMVGLQERIAPSYPRVW